MQGLAPPPQGDIPDSEPFTHQDMKATTHEIVPHNKERVSLEHQNNPERGQHTHTHTHTCIHTCTHTHSHTTAHHCLSS